MATDIGRIAFLWRGIATRQPNAENNLLRPVFDALAAVNVAAEPPRAGVPVL